MPPKSFDTADKLLQYTAVAADAFHNVAVATRIPFLNSVCTLSLTLIPLVKVWHSGIQLPVLAHCAPRPQNFKKTDASG
jgi:hypothetical protein